MVKRTVQFTVKADGGVTPAIPLFGGVKGEHNATELAITLESGMYTAGEAVRLSFTTGDGTVLSSDLIKDLVIAEDNTAIIRYSLPQLLTVAAGQLCVRVVISGFDENGKETKTRRLGEMVLYFDHADVENGTPFWTGVSEMLTRTTTAKDAAVAAARDANIEAIKACVSASDAQGFADDAEASAAEATAARDAIEPVKNMVNEAFKYKGKVATGAVLAAKPDAKYRDVWFVENEKCFYMYDGEDWISFGNGAGGANGITPHIGANGNWFIGDEDTGVKAQGEKGDKGDQGDQGEQGEKGDPYTLTDTDKAAIVSDVLTALGGAPVFGYVDGDNTIVVSGNLASGEYTIKYEMEDGTTVDIGTLTLSADEPDEPVASFTNQIPISTDASGALFVGTNGEAGYKTGYRLSMSAGTEKALDGYAVTGFIPAKNGDVLRIKNITVADENNINIAGYDANKQPLNGGTTTYGTTLYNMFVTRGTEENGVYTATITQDMHLGFGADLAYIRIGSTSITADSILTINQAIV